MPFSPAVKRRRSRRSFRTAVRQTRWHSLFAHPKTASGSRHCSRFSYSRMRQTCTSSSALARSRAKRATIDRMRGSRRSRRSSPASHALAWWSSPSSWCTIRSSLAEVLVCVSDRTSKVANGAAEWQGSFAPTSCREVHHPAVDMPGTPGRTALRLGKKCPQVATKRARNFPFEPTWAKGLLEEG